MKVIEAISDTNIGGAGVLLLNRLECTDLEKYQTTVLLPCGSRLTQGLERLGVDYREIDCCGDRSWALADMIKYKREIEKISPHIINCHGCLSARVAAKLSGVPVKICTRHCVFPVTKKEKKFGIINNWLSDCFIAVAYSAKENLIALGIDEEKIRVIINGAKTLREIGQEERIQIKKRLGIGEGSLVLIMCARLEKCKGHIVLLSAVKELVKEGIDCVAIFLGSGTEENALKKYCSDNGIQDRVIFVGFVEDVAPYMSIADLNINCSVGTETSSLALSEGMSLGVPAIVSDYGGNAYMVRDGENGLVYPTGDWKALAECIKRMMGNKEEYKKMCRKSKERFDNELNSLSMTQKNNRLYDELFIKSRKA